MGRSEVIGVMLGGSQGMGSGNNVEESGVVEGSKIMG